MVAYTGDYDDDVLKRVASTEAAIGQQEFLEQYDPSAELVNYPSRDEAFRAMSRGEVDSVIGNASIMQLFTPNTIRSTPHTSRPAKVFRSP